MQKQLAEGAKTIGSKGKNWSLEHRLQFIDFRLRWEGRINRTDLTDYFGLSVPQASLDIAKYIELAPTNLTYDRSSKTYVASQPFKALYQRSSARRYLSELLSTKTGVMDPAASFIGTSPEFDWTPSPWRLLNDITVELLVKAIREQLAVHVRYQSMTSIEESERLLSPHALGYDGFRWHVRAYCHKRQRFSDFVLARILHIGDFTASDMDPSSDVQWQTILSLILVPNPTLSSAKKRIIELDYGMNDGQVHLPCRQALLYYTLRRLGLHFKKEADPVEQQIVLQNREAIQPYIDALTTQS